MKDILVSILCIAYNQEKYIRDTLNGFLSQIVDFNYEIIIHDDASTDKTLEIIREYEKMKPDVFHVIEEKENQYSKGLLSNAIMNMLTMCQGKYISFCEGDDFWIDQHKLQLQIDWMEKNPDYYLMAHNALMINYTDNSLHTINPYKESQTITPEELIMQYNGNLPTASLVFKADVKNMPSFFLECGVGDIPMQFYCMGKGKIYYCDRVMSVYRYNHQGSWCNLNLSTNINKLIAHYARMMRFCDQYDVYSGRKFSCYLFDLKLKYLFTIISKCNSFPVELLKREIDQLIDCDNINLKEYYSKISDLYLQLNKKDFISEALKEKVQKDRKIYIWGTGQYGMTLAQKFNANGIDYEGFVVSDDFNFETEFQKKKVNKISEISCKENIFIVVAVNVELWKNIRKKIEKLETIDYCYMLCI